MPGGASYGADLSAAYRLAAYRLADLPVSVDGLLGLDWSRSSVEAATENGPTATALAIGKGAVSSLTTSPEQVLAAIYQFIGEPAFQHDFENLSFDALDFDARAGTPGLHEVRPGVAPIARKTILPPDLFQRFERNAFWLDPKLNPNNVIVV